MRAAGLGWDIQVLLYSDYTVQIKRQISHNWYFFLRYGTMHVVATNIILWILVLVKETLDEIGEIEEEVVKSQKRMAAHHHVSIVSIHRSLS